MNSAPLVADATSSSGSIPLTVVSRLTGPTDLGAARAWQRSLHGALRAVPRQAEVRLLVDQSGYRPAGLDVHRLVRTVVPDLLATYGVRPALSDLFGAATVAVNSSPDRRVVACALVQDNPVKMAKLDRAVGRADQRFFSDVEVARAWLESAPAPTVGRPVHGLLAGWRATRSDQALIRTRVRPAAAGHLPA